jgi:hypothetical protein
VLSLNCWKYSILKKEEDFVNQIYALTGSKINSMRISAENTSLVKKLDKIMNLIKKKRMRDSPTEPLS